MAKKQHLSRIDTDLQSEIEKFKLESSQPSAELPTVQSVNESVERLTTPTLTTPTPKPIEKVAPVVKVDKKKPKTPKEEIERGRDFKGELNRVGSTILFDRNLLKEIKIYAVKNGVSMSDVVNDALHKYLNV